MSVYNDFGLANAPPPVPAEADFTASPMSGAPPLLVNFVNQSSGDFDACDWDFGDGGAGSECSDPAHTYTASGVYTVTLEVSGLGGTDTETKPAYIAVEDHRVYLPMVLRNTR
jgi:PKD repeat protein